MMNIRHTIPLLLSIAMLTACSENYTSEEAQQGLTHEEDLVPVQFSVSDQRTIDFTDYTRATTSIITFDASEVIKVFVKPNGSTSYTGYDYTTASSGQNVSLTTPATPPYYPPGTGTQVEAYAYYPSTAGALFTVADDQTSDANYKASDLMYAANRIVTKGGTNGNDRLSMAHQMAQLRIAANAQSGSGITVTRVEVIAQKSVTFAPNTADIVTTTGAAGTIKALNGPGTGYIVIPPQVVNGVIIKVYTGAETDAEIATYAFTGSGTFNSGDSYSIDLTISADQLGFTTAINNWNGVGSVNVIPAGTLTILSDPGLTAIPAQEFTSSAIMPAFIVKKGDETVDPSLYTTIWVNNVNSGKAYIIVTGTGTQEGAVGMTSFTITPANGKITYDVTSVTKTYGNEPFTNPLRNFDPREGHEGQEADGPVTYHSSDETVATVDEVGKVTLHKAGTTQITATATNGANYVYSTTNGDHTSYYDLTVNSGAGSISFDYSTHTEWWSPTTAENTYTQTVINTGDAIPTYSINEVTNSCGATIDSSTGEVTFTQSGSVQVTATVANTDCYTYASTTASYILTINRAPGFITLSPTSGTVDAGSSVSFNVLTNHGGTLSVADVSGNNRSTPSISGTVVNVTTTNGRASSATIRVTCAETSCYSEASADFALTINANIDIRTNPLWFVAQYNMVTGGALTFATTDNAGYFFTWADAMSKFAAQTSGYSNYRNAGKNFGGVNYHLPVQAEWWSIAPGAETNVFTLDNGSGTYRSAYITPKWGYDATTKAGILESSYWRQISANEIRAIRFLGTEYCSAWKYQLLGGGTSSNPAYVVISATLIETVENSSAAAAAWYNANIGSVTWGNNENAGAVQRTFYARGMNSTGASTVGDSEVGLFGDYWGASSSGEYSWSLCIRNGGLFTSYGSSRKKTVGLPVRLFRDSDN